jgi:hypothetical protein
MKLSRLKSLLILFLESTDTEWAAEQRINALKRTQKMIKEIIQDNDLINEESSFVDQKVNVVSPQHVFVLNPEQQDVLDDERS